MKKLYLLLFIGIIVLPKFSYSQKRTVTQTTNIRTLFSIPLDTNLEKLTDPDLARMEIKDKLESKEVIISKKDLAMEIIITDLTEYENLSDYKFGIRTTVLNTHGIELYDYEDSLVSFVVHEEPGAASFYTLPEKMYPDYGFFNNLFEFNTEKAAENLLSENYTVEYSPKNKILKAYNDSVQLSIDFQNLYYETLFFRDNELKYIDYKYYIKDGDHIVPFKESYSSFEYTINGIRMLRTNETTYIEYSVTEGDSVLYERSEKQQNNNKGINFHQYTETDIRHEYMKAYPNPAHSSLNIELPFLPDGNTDIEIIDIQGNNVLTKSNINSPDITVDISGLKSGTYVINCKNNAGTRSVRFVKN